jgi:hypothetical protein
MWSFISAFFKNGVNASLYAANESAPRVMNADESTSSWMYQVIVHQYHIGVCSGQSTHVGLHDTKWMREAPPYHRCHYMPLCTITAGLFILIMLVIIAQHVANSVSCILHVCGTILSCRFIDACVFFAGLPNHCVVYVRRVEDCKGKRSLHILSSWCHRSYHGLCYDWHLSGLGDR